MFVDIVIEGDMYQTVFISYGGTDSKAASRINSALKGKGVKTWYFPVDAQPGQKLHRVMHEGVNTHDKVLLICSKAALSRPGVLNELERVLEREAREGGSSVLIPITLDKHVYGDWAPSNPDVADQVRSRVITEFPARTKGQGFEVALDALVKAIQRRE